MDLLAICNSLLAIQNNFSVMQHDTSAVTDKAIPVFNDNKIIVTYPTRPINMINMSINNSHFVRCLNEKKRDSFITVQYNNF